jgi:fimbrial chaperone protein
VLVRASIVLLAFLAAGSAAAAPDLPGGLNIDPTRIVLQAQHPVSSLSVANEGTVGVLMRVSAVSWSQHSRDRSLPRDTLMPTGDLIAVPPIFLLEPGASQIVRVGLTQTGPVGREAAYRLLVGEVPTRRPGDLTSLVSLRLSIPVFASPRMVSVERAEWSAAAPDENHLEVTLRNNGNNHLHVAWLRLYADAQHRVLLAAKPVATYVLAGQSATWSFSAAGARAQAIFIEADSVEGPLRGVAVVRAR